MISREEQGRFDSILFGKYEDMRQSIKVMPPEKYGHYISITFFENNLMFLNFNIRNKINFLAVDEKING